MRSSTEMSPPKMPGTIPARTPLLSVSAVMLSRSSAIGAPPVMLSEYTEPLSFSKMVMKPLPPRLDIIGSTSVRVAWMAAAASAAVPLFMSICRPAIEASEWPPVVTSPWTPTTVGRCWVTPWDGCASRVPGRPVSRMPRPTTATKRDKRVRITRHLLG